MKLSPVSTLAALVAFAVSATAAAGGSGSECVPLLRGNLQEPLYMPPTAGPSNQRFDLANGTGAAVYDEVGLLPTSIPLPTSTATEPVHTSEAVAGQASSEAPGDAESWPQGRSDVPEMSSLPAITNEMLKAEFESRASCITHGHSCLPGWTNPPKKCCSGLRCYAIIGGVGGWCWRKELLSKDQDI
ncbi:hypothetical protein BDY19DRAFT_908160 [Irpex rosettiformis]|uniref:Uncharacterized protein n=1 Tax=Irpex rosettiformis TaxID=378272 RepID=A0ACB8TWW4_9APHY|nr:hypothetical protein BDY19DRAFT_908160 [Irpex rosettiformis]